MSDQQQNEPPAAARDQAIRAALDQHWTASDANDFETEHLIYHETLCWTIRSPVSEPAVDATYRISAPTSQTKSGLQSDESSAAEMFGSPNSS